MPRFHSMKSFNVAVGLTLLLYGNTVLLWVLSDRFQSGPLGFFDGVVFALAGVVILIDERNRS